MKTKILFKLAASSVIGLGVAFLAACGAEVVGYEGCLDNLTRAECEAIERGSQQVTVNMTGS